MKVDANIPVYLEHLWGKRHPALPSHRAEEGRDFGRQVVGCVQMCKAMVVI